MGGFKGEYVVNLFKGEDVVMELDCNKNYANFGLITAFFYLVRRRGLCLYSSDLSSPGQV
ncbi:hypothetical protein E5S67_02997 [Microcoleus sp. IPMA8]|uniref:Uncharacterized protein n=1 Tax=Microcoleus asticus IPMA8 TaxID=2563858 RepID=A0ABX2CZV5_9CYAN|nr:hypothetical protein [Microcoleus asticus IPMA8]